MIMMDEVGCGTGTPSIGSNGGGSDYSLGESRRIRGGGGSGGVVVLRNHDASFVAFWLGCIPEDIYPHPSLAVPFVVVEDRHRDYVLVAIVGFGACLWFVWLSLVRPIHAACSWREKERSENI